MKLIFKAISLDTNKWIEGYGVAYNEAEDLAVIIHQQKNNLMQHSAVYPKTICQFTGYYDLGGKGKMIFDKDIFISEKIGVVTWDNGGWVVKMSTYEIPLGNFIRNDETRETIGNLVQNAEAAFIPMSPTSTP